MQANRQEPAVQTSILTLKNLYRLLTQDDMFLPSYPVFSEKDTLGLTLNRFWKHYFQRALPKDTDFSFFDDTRKRRTLNRLMNRNGGAEFLNSWFQELTDKLDPSLLGQMTHVWLAQLNRYHANTQSLTLRLKAFSALITTQADLSHKESEQFLEKLISDLVTPSEIPFLFYGAYMLSWLTLCALYGNRVHEPAFSILRMNPLASCQALYSTSSSRSVSSEPPLILGRNCAVSTLPLPEKAYFGQNQTLEVARQLLREHGKLAVCGMGGIGKTEFVRQLIRYLTNTGEYQRIAYVQFHQNLETSFLSAFPELGEQAGIKSVQHLLEESEDDKTLLVLDQVDNTSETDSVFDTLFHFGCDVILTTRAEQTASFLKIRISGLSSEAGEALFLFHHPTSRGENEQIRELCTLIDGHPLAIQLFARLCHIRFWKVAQLLIWFRERGLLDLRYVQDGTVIWLSSVLSGMFELASLNPTQQKLMQLLSVGPYRYWLPDELARYTADITPDRETLADLCQILYDTGFLLRTETGYAIHPLIAETVRLTPVTPDEFSLLWDALAEDIRERFIPGCELLISAFLRIPEADLTVIRCLARLEASIDFIPFLRLPEPVYEKHGIYLKTHPHDTPDAVDYQLALGLRDIVFLSRIDRLKEYLRNICGQAQWHPFSGNLQSLYTLLEYASAGQETGLVQQIFDLVIPEDENSILMAKHLISYSIKQRRADHDPTAALYSLEKAEQILAKEENVESGDVSDRLQMLADLAYRKGICQLDLDAADEAQASLGLCLKRMEQIQIPSDSAKGMATRSTYAVSLWLCGKKNDALTEYRLLTEIYKKQKREHSQEYAMMRNNTALVLAETHRLSEAEDTIREVVQLDEELTLARDIVATHYRNAAFILSERKKRTEAEVFARKAVSIRKDYFGADSPWTADAEAVYAFILKGLGRCKDAEALITRSCEQLLKVWGADHRHTRNAVRIQKSISQS